MKNFILAFVDITFDVTRTLYIQDLTEPNLFPNVDMLVFMALKFNEIWILYAMDESL